LEYLEYLKNKKINNELKYTLKIECITLNEYFEEIKKERNSFFLSKFKVGKFKIDSNFKKDFSIKNEKNPFKNFKIFKFQNSNINLKTRKKYNKKIIATSYFNGCFNKLCSLNKIDNKELQILENIDDISIDIPVKIKIKDDNKSKKKYCSANILINYIYNTSGQIELQVLSKGNHNEFFYPSTKNIKKNPKLINLIKIDKKNSEILKEIEKTKKKNKKLK